VQFFAQRRAPLRLRDLMLSPRTIAVYVAAFALLHALGRGWLNPFGFHPRFYHNPVHVDALASSLIFVGVGVVAFAVAAAITYGERTAIAGVRCKTYLPVHPTAGLCGARFLAERALFAEVLRIVRTRSAPARRS